MNETRPSTALLSLVVPAYNVQKYLPDFLKSLSAQPLDDTEIIFVDDGSPDDSAAVIAAWITGHPHADAHLVSQENRGLSGARNTGLARATGTWISFPDPDDILGDTYLTDVRRMIASVDETVSMVAAPLITFVEETGKIRDDHPLSGLFARGAGIYRLEQNPSAIKIHANTSFLRRDAINRMGLAFDSEVRPNFEDTALIARYLAGFDKPSIAAVPSAEYRYRTRADASSLVASSWTNPAKYTVLPETGWLRLLKDLESSLGSVPTWAQNIVLYDMSWYFKHDSRIHTPTKRLNDATKSRFMELVAEVMTYISAEVVLDYEITQLSYEIRMLLLAIKGVELDWLPVTVWRADNTKGLVQLKYYFTRERPAEVFSARGIDVRPRHAKDRAVTYFGRTPLYERIVWIAYVPDLRITLNGAHRTVHIASGSQPGISLSPSIARRAGWRPGPPTRSSWIPSEPNRSTGWISRQVASRSAQITRILEGRSPRFLRPLDRFTSAVAKATRRYANAWVFMDRDAQAQDNAEHLYRWVSREHPEINSWFVLSRRSPDWPRLRNEGFRLVAHGSWQHKLLLLNTVHLASSHVDHYVVQPLHPKRFPKRPWRYTFLQHGVTKDDISRWLNPKPIRRIISTGQAEQSGFVADGTSYGFTDRESVLTGFPRHDELLRLAQGSSPKDRGSILVAPTWREYLLGPTNGKGNFRPLTQGFSESEYVISWRNFLSSPELHSTARALGKRIVFLPHPNLEPHIDAMALPPSIDVRLYADSNVQEIIADAAVLVTDYSSIAFDAAYIRSTSVYFQFDRQEFFSSHPHRPGYFSYVEHGFGPVTTTVEAAVSATRSALSESPDTIVYRDRAEAFFEYRDGRCCQRVFESMLAIDAL